MIVRILGEGQYDVDEQHLATLEDLDAKLNAALEADDPEAFAAYLDQLISLVREHGAIGPERFVPSDLTVPHEGSSIHEVRELLASEEAEES